MQKKKFNKPTTINKPKIKNKSEWINGRFKSVVNIINMTNKHMMEIEMVDNNGNIIIWYGRNYDTNKIKLNNKLEIVGKIKYHIEVNGIKKNVIKYLTY